MRAEPSDPIVLPRGLYDAGGACHREAVLRPIRGYEEMALAGAGSSAASAFLAACVDRIGDFSPIEPAHAAALTRGDRQHIALQLRARLFGDRVSLVLTCPNPSCGELADLDLSVAAISAAPDRVVPEVLSIETPEGTARVREPTGADDELMERATGDRRARSALLWSRLLVDLDGRGALTPDAFQRLAAPTRHAIATGLADRGGALDLAFLSTCPACHALLETELDPIDLLVRELRFGAERLLAEIHCFAWYYHWSEDDVLALPRARRWRYLELLARQVEGRPLFDPWGLA